MDNSVIFPPRSTLYALAPVGVGTAYVERITSYVSRLARGHNISVGTLVLNVIQPNFQAEYLSNNLRTTDLLKKASCSINGTESWAREMVRILSDLTLVKGLEYLTMLPWADIFPVRGLLKRTHAWCPLCYEDWMQQKQVIYDPLVWAIELVKVCRIHEKPLREECPECRRTQPVLSRYSVPGYCVYCHHWLGEGGTKGRGDGVEGGSEKDLWISDEVGKLLEAAHNPDWDFTLDIFRGNLQELIDLVSGGCNAEFANCVQRHPYTVKSWIDGTQEPTLGAMLELASATSISLVDLLTKQGAVRRNTAFSPPVAYGKKKESVIMTEK